MWRKQQQMHWMPDEIPMGDDVKDFKNKLTKPEKNLLTHIFRLFTQSDVEISNCYHKVYIKLFKPVEIQMMLTGFANAEVIHIVSYAHLLDTLGLPEVEFNKFAEYQAMKDKIDFLHSFDPSNPYDIALSLAAFSGATEGVSLFASFAMLMNFGRFNKMKGMFDIIKWSIRDEELHVEGITKLFKTFLKEHPEIDKVKLEKDIHAIFEQVVANEDAFIDLAFEEGPVEGLTPNEMKQYIRYIADIRLKGLGFKKVFKIGKNPLPWLEGLINSVEHGNFFESRPTGYSRGATLGEWEDVYD